MVTLSHQSPQPVAGHSASVLGDQMVVFGGSQVPGVRSAFVLQSSVSHSLPVVLHVILNFVNNVVPCSTHDCALEFLCQQVKIYGLV